MNKTFSIFWGYKEKNGDLKVKPFYNYDVIDDAYINPSFVSVIKPFKANDINDALNKIKK